MAIARIDNGAVVEIRDLALETVPAHKRGMWRLVVGDAPTHDPRMQTVSGPEWQVTAEAATRVWTVQDRPLQERVAAVKEEARRRILNVYPEWRQTNMVARGVELQEVWRQNGSWTLDEAGEAGALQGAWDWIKSVRDASGVIEALDPIPADFDADARWPGV